jgi:V8-like Glu-specific endopeptidase
MTVFGVDDRVPVPSTQADPWRAITQLVATYPDGTRSQGSGAMIGRKHVLTVAHLVYNRDHGGWARSVQVSAGLNGTQRPFGIAWATRQTTTAQWVRSRDFDHDLAVLTLDRNLGKLTGWFDVEDRPHRADPRTLSVTTAGYPADRGGTVLYTSSGMIQSAQAHQFSFTLDVSPGQSGSPLWSTDSRTGRRAIHGVISSASSQANHATRITRRALLDIRRWTRIDTTVPVGTASRVRSAWTMALSTVDLPSKAVSHGTGLIA